MIGRDNKKYYIILLYILFRIIKMAAIRNAFYQTNLVAATNCVWLPLTQSGQANSQNDVNQWIQDSTD